MGRSLYETARIAATSASLQMRLLLTPVVRWPADKRGLVGVGLPVVVGAVRAARFRVPVAPGCRPSRAGRRGGGWPRPVVAALDRGGWGRRWRASLFGAAGWRRSGVCRGPRAVRRSRRRGVSGPGRPPVPSRRAGAARLWPRAGAAPRSRRRCHARCLPALRRRVPRSEPQAPHQVYGRIALPPVRPGVARVRLFGGRCACCGARRGRAGAARAGAGLAVRPSIAALVVYLHYAPALGFWSRLCALMGGVFALALGGGAVGGVLLRARCGRCWSRRGGGPRGGGGPPGGLLRRGLGAGGRRGLVGVGVCRRLGGVARPSPPPRPRPWSGRCSAPFRRWFWVSDMLGRPRGRGVVAGRCLARLLRAARYAVACGDAAFSAAFKRLLLRAIALGGAGARWEVPRWPLMPLWLAGSAGSWRLSRSWSGARAARRLAARPPLFVFVTHRCVPSPPRLRTAPASPRALPSPRVPLRWVPGLRRLPSVVAPAPALRACRPPRLCCRPTRRNHRAG